MEPRYRFSDRLSVALSGALNPRVRALGYVGHSAPAVDEYALAGLKTGVRDLDAGAGGYEALARDAIVMSYRDVDEVQLELSVDYSFSANLTLDVRVRHYWSEVEHVEFFEIARDELPRPTP